MNRQKKTTVYARKRGIGLAKKAARPDFEASRIRFLDAADRVFIKLGYDGSTIRAITLEAKTSLARLNRHWTGKEDLFRDVFARHFNPIHAAQNARLDAIDAAGPIGAKDLLSILEAFFSPALLGNVGPQEQRTSHLVYCRAIIDPAPEVKKIVAKLVNDLRPRLIGTLRKALPDLEPEAFFYAIMMVMGAYIYPQVFGAQLALAMGITFEAVDWTRAGSIIANILKNGLSTASTAPAQYAKHLSAV